MYTEDHNKNLFCDGDLSDALRSYTDKIKVAVDEIARDQFLNTPKSDLIDHLVSRFTVEPLEIHEDQISATQKESKIDVSGDPQRDHFGRSGPLLIPALKVTIELPYYGSPVLWKLRPDSWHSSFPKAVVVNYKGRNEGTLSIIIKLPSDSDPSKFNSRKGETISDIRFYIQKQSPQIENYNASLRSTIETRVNSRIERLKKHDGVMDLLGIPLKRMSSAPEIRPITIKKKQIKPLPAPPKDGYKAEPGITDGDYDYILNVIRHEGRTFETTPKTYHIHDEEELRDILLSHLNGHYEGGANGEAFRRSGKTDIKIEASNRAAFVAECKIWRGAKELIEACDQLLGYLTWRDCKTALVVFNKNVAGFTSIREKAPAELKKHPLFKRELKFPQSSEGEWRYVFSDPQDSAREIIVHCFLFNIYALKTIK